MKQIITFYKEDNRWYAYLPEYINAGGSKEECEMVLGADVLLDILSNYSDSIKLEVSTNHLDNYTEKLLYIGDTELVDEGTYIGYQYYYEKVWLCEVTKFIFGNYPQVIYLKKIS